MTGHPRLARLFRGLTLFSVGGLVIVVIGAAVVAILAEFAKTWRWYFRMEQAMALAAPVTITLLGLALVGFVGVVAVANDD